MAPTGVVHLVADVLISSGQPHVWAEKCTRIVASVYPKIRTEKY